jgi:uncharacterized membrane protein (DUF106 family)
MERIPDGYFYYGLTVILAGVLIGVIWRFANKLAGTLEALKVTVHELVAITKVHQEKHEQHEKDIEELKDGKYRVKYRK